MTMGVRRRTLLTGMAAASVAACSRPQTAAAENSFVVQGATVFDGLTRIDADTVVVENGLISAVGRGVPLPAGFPVHDGTGGMVLPGLVDAHVHILGAQSRLEAPKFGVTTMLDMFNRFIDGLATERARLTRDSLADVWSAGKLVTVAGGHGTQYGAIQTLDDGDAVAFVAARLAEGSDYIKVVIENGSAYGRRRPTLTPEQVRAVVAAAHAKGVLTAVHVSTVDGALVAARAGGDVLAHAPKDRKFTPAEVEAVASSGVAVVATLSVAASMACGDHAATIARDPRLNEDQRSQLTATWSAGCWPAFLANASANVAALHRAGVPILAGTDAPNPGTTFGVSLAGEVALLTAAGLPIEAALAAATAAPADRFRLTDRGRIVAGRRADLVLVGGDPTRSVGALTGIRAVWKNGFAVPV